ncbi:unnamed protein product [Nippostrongylus brasiliensis]|uniref:CCHC-type domain-containing protein n=1 Tax=Nippostrongylus brasiliensis TaxID=27835 RepID=A0A0N4Y668_NIPBR|nr:unnamed protein product [Nippostrongylus brasiliensis]
MEQAPGQELASERPAEERREEGSDSVDVSELRGPRSPTNKAMDADLMDVELEREFQKLCGEDCEPEAIQVCNRLERAIKDTEVLVIAEVAKAIRVGHPSRDAVERVGRKATETALDLVHAVRTKCKEGVVVKKWVQIVLESLGSENRAEAVEKLIELLEVRDELTRLSEAHGVALAGLPLRFEEIQKENMLLQETVRDQANELDELREVKRQLEQRELELQRLRATLGRQGSSTTGTETTNTGGRRRAADVLNILRSEDKVHSESKAFQRDRLEGPRMIEPRVEQHRSQPSYGIGCRTMGELDWKDEGKQGESACERSRSEEMTQYLRFMALPEVRPYSGEEATYNFNTFLENFSLKYPRNGWGDAELGVLLRSKLIGKARTQYEALPRAVREGSFEGQVDALRQACRSEVRNQKVVALGELRKLKKKEGQSVADFCLVLEQLTRRAHPHMSESVLDAERAQILYEQLAHWEDSYHLLEALESEDQPYEKLKQTAMRIERRNVTLRNRGTVTREVNGVNGDRDGVAVRGLRAGQRDATDPGEDQSLSGAKKRGQVCYRCHEAGHIAKDCSNREPRGRDGNSRTAAPLSSRLLQAAWRAIGRSEINGARSGGNPATPAVGRKYTTTVEMFGRKWTGLLDTGSEVSIIPAEVLLMAKEDGFDIDREVVEHRVDQSVRICDASGEVMRFVALVEVKVKEVPGTREVVAKMYVTAVRGSVLILGTNVLPALGYALRKQETGGGIDSQTGKAREGDLTEDMGRRTRTKLACVARRAYIAPGALDWVQLQGCEQGEECMLTTSHALVQSGVCKAGNDGMVEVPVVNRSQEPVVLRVGQSVGSAERDVGDSRSEATVECLEYEQRGRECTGLVRTPGRNDEDGSQKPRGVLLIVPVTLRALKRVRGWKETTIFFYRTFWEINPGQETLFGGCAKNVIVVFPSQESRAGSWSPMVEALGMWLAEGATIYMVAGPRTSTDQAWAEVAEKARRHVCTYIKRIAPGKERRTTAGAGIVFRKEEFKRNGSGKDATFGTGDGDPTSRPSVTV